MEKGKGERKSRPESPRTTPPQPNCFSVCRSHTNTGTVSALTIFLFLFVNDLTTLCGVAELAPPGSSLEMWSRSPSQTS